MNFKETLQFAAALPPSVPIFFLGRPGIGKSAVSRAIGAATAKLAADAGAECRVVRRELTGHLPEDISGIPFERDGFTHFFPPAFLGTLAKQLGDPALAKGKGKGKGEVIDPYGALILEDITQAQKAVQVACFQLVQERSMGDLELSDNVRVILTGNRASDKAGARELPSPLRNRVMLLSLEPDPEEWMFWAASQGLPGVIGAFLNYKPQFFSQLPSQGCKENGQFATPRAWENLGRIYDACIAHGGGGPGGLEPLRTAAGGLVGNGTGTEFVAFVKLQKELPNPQAVLDNPEKVMPDPPKDPDRLTALVTALGEYAAVNQDKDTKMPLKLLLALAHVSAESREGVAAGVSVFQANKGDVTKLVEQAAGAKKDPRVLKVLKFFAEATKA